MIKEINVPDIGDFDGIEVIEILVAVGDAIEKEQSIITLESEKLTMDIPTPEAGIVEEIYVSFGQKISENELILKLETTTSTEPKKPETKESKVEETSKAKQEDSISSTKANYDAQVVVLGAGLGGYTAAFRAADLGLKTILIERYDSIGGVCLNVGCIPSKALLHIGKIISEVDELKEHGIDLGSKIPTPKPVRIWTESVINKLTSGLKSMAKKRNVEIVHGIGKFTSTNSIEVKHNGDIKEITFGSAIIAACSQDYSLNNSQTYNYLKESGISDNKIEWLISLLSNNELTFPC